MANRFQSYEIEELVTDGKCARVKLYDPLRNEYREGALYVRRDRVTNELSVGVYGHYSDPDSEPWFEGTEPWPEAQKRGRDE